MSEHAIRKQIFTSWKTTIGGVLMAVGATLQGAAIDMSDATYLGLVGSILLAIGAFFTGVSARDNDKSSIDVEEDIMARANRARDKDNQKYS